MLSVPNLDDLGYERLFERVRSQIPLHTEVWTDFNDSDPGITTLQTLAWLTDTLNYYINATGEQHRLKYLSLLGLRPACSAAQCHIALSGVSDSIAIARGAKLTAGDIVFELSESFCGVPNSVLALFGESDGAFRNLTPFAGVDGQYATVFTRGREGESALYVGLQNAPEEKTVRFYVEVQPHPARVPFTDSFTLTELCWEFFDGTRWQPAHVLQDDTGGFLRSGFIQLALEHAVGYMRAHPVLPNGYYLRARLLQGEYDASPKIGKIYLNCVQAVQTHTYAQALEYTYRSEAEIVLDYYVREDDRVCVAVEEADGYSLWFEHRLDARSLCEVKTGHFPWQRVLSFDCNRFGCVPAEGQRILVTVTDAKFHHKLRFGVTGGYAQERMKAELENLYELRLALVEEKDGRPYYRIWEACENIREAAYNARVFQRDGDEIVFGDSLAGEQPHAGQLVVAITAKTSLLDKGNVRAGQIKCLADACGNTVQVRNPAPAVGGQRPKTSYELEQEIEGKIYKTLRAVTEEDYIAIVRSTPGLMIDSVTVMNHKTYASYYGGATQPGQVLVVVKPYSEQEAHPVLSDVYRRRIREHLESYRLLTTDIRILCARYVDVEVEGRIILTENTASTREQVVERLRTLLDFSHTKAFGKSIVYGQVFSALEMLPCVAKVNQLSFSCIGEGARLDERGNVVVFPDALAYLGKVNIEFVREER